MINQEGVSKDPGWLSWQGTLIAIKNQEKGR